MTNENKCLKCNQTFKGGEKYLKISNDPKAGTYHESCWSQVERERNNPNSNLTCEKCKKQIGKGEKWKSETFPDAFQPHTVYYCEPCWEQRQSENRIKLCKDCGHEMYSSVCQWCAINQMNRDHLNRFGNGNDDRGGVGVPTPNTRSAVKQV